MAMMCGNCCSNEGDRSDLVIDANFRPTAAVPTDDQGGLPSPESAKKGGAREAPPNDAPDDGAAIFDASNGAGDAGPCGPDAERHESAFTAVITKRPGSSLGLDVYSEMHAGLPIQSVKDGMVHEWNEANPTKMLRCGDTIEKVNGAVLPAAMLAELRDQNVLTMQIKRGSECVVEDFTATIVKKAGFALGLDVDHFDPSWLLVKEVKSGGLTMLWNDRHPDSPLEVGHWITRVNDVTGNSERMIQECRQAAELVLRCRRYMLPSARYVQVAIWQKPAPDNPNTKRARLNHGLVAELPSSADTAALSPVVVQSIEDDSLLSEWNDAHPDKAVAAGDVVVQVNHVYGGSEAILAELDNSAKARLLLIVRRSS